MITAGGTGCPEDSLGPGLDAQAAAAGPPPGREPAHGAARPAAAVAAAGAVAAGEAARAAAASKAGRSAAAISAAGAVASSEAAAAAAACEAAAAAASAQVAGTPGAAAAAGCSCFAVELRARGGRQQGKHLLDAGAPLARQQGQRRGELAPGHAAATLQMRGVEYDWVSQWMGEEGSNVEGNGQPSSTWRHTATAHCNSAQH